MITYWIKSCSHYVNKIQSDLSERDEEGTQSMSEGKTRDRNIITRNLPMRDNEDILKYRVQNLIRDSLKLKNITVLTAERLSKFSSKPGIVH